ncbi:MAG: tagaturonate reductase [bacterium]|jgi:tagaturonate reductase
MQVLNKHTIKEIVARQGLSLPGSEELNYPERVLQFGTGVLLRALPDHFIDQANKHGKFKGRVVVVKSTAAGSSDEFNQQDGLYTICIRGLQNGDVVDQTSVNGAISRVLSAKDQWQDILEFATSADLQVVISNTTEVGIAMSDDKITDAPPASYPGKLLAVLYNRYKHFSGSPNAGLVIIPTELIEENGTKLKKIIHDLAVNNSLDQAFIAWLIEHNHFCNSLVDRIVPGKMSADAQAVKESELGYSDQLMIMAEPFSLWAIESTDERVKRTLSFANSEAGCIIVDDIYKYKELKLRLLNGTHSFSCALALLAGFGLVREAMADERMNAFVKNLMMDDIVAAIEGDKIGKQEAEEFAQKVIDRFSNPFIDHKWSAISVQYTTKMKMRNVPLFIRSVAKFGKVPDRMVVGFAAYLLLMNSVLEERDVYFSRDTHERVRLNDDFAAVLHKKWQAGSIESALSDILADQQLWGEDLMKLPGFSTQLLTAINKIMEQGVRSCLS